MPRSLASSRGRSEACALEDGAEASYGVPVRSAGHRLLSLRSEIAAAISVIPAPWPRHQLMARAFPSASLIRFCFSPAQVDGPSRSPFDMFIRTPSPPRR
jgi:hypothetical protein